MSHPIITATADIRAVLKGVAHANPTFMTTTQKATALRELVQQWWLPQWEVPAGTVREEHVLGYPVCNLVAEAGAIRLYGPTTRAAVRRLEGRGWAVGALTSAPFNYSWGRTMTR